MQESETMAKVREASKPLVGAVVEGGKVVGEKLHQSAEAAKPGFEAVGRYVDLCGGREGGSEGGGACCEVREASKFLVGASGGGREGGG